LKEGDGRTEHFLLQPCRNTAAFEVRPRHRGSKVDMEVARTRLEKAGFRLVADAGVMLIMERECGINIWPLGKLLIRTMEEPLARRLAKEVMGSLFESGL